MQNVAKRIVIAALVVLSACGGSGGGGSDDSNEQAGAPILACGGRAAAECPDGYRCVDDASRDCAVGEGGDCAGVCVLGDPLPSCGDSPQACGDGFVCVNGACQPAADGECEADSDCGAILAPCSICADGTASCPLPVCDQGRCSVTFKPCAPATCGGFAGTECAPGDVCVDDPTDECDPASGGADCPGICQPAPPPPCDGFAGLACPDGFQCTDDPSDGCDPASGGADCPGICEPATLPECASDQDCPQLRAPCSVCPDGSEMCPSSSCQNGRCQVHFPTCEAPLPCGDEGCKPGYVCVNEPTAGCDPSSGVACDGMCVLPDGPQKCGGVAGEACPAGFECVDDTADDCRPDAGGADCPGICQPANTGECTSDAECPVILVACSVCPDGSFACPEGRCENGTCQLSFGACEGPGFCGGIAGFPCEPGFTCIDNPGDDCDPARGGADCGGICVREDQPPACGGFAGLTCPDGFECADDARDDCDPANGADCPGVCRPAPVSKCNSDADCVVIGAPCVICDDGTAACPRSYCDDGECRGEFETCA